MKILHVVHGYHPVIGGTEWLLKNMSEQLVARHQDNVTVFTGAVTKPSYYWCNEGKPMPVGIETINGVTVRRFPFSKRFQFLRMVLARGFYRLKLPYHDWARTIQLGPTMPQLSDAVAQSGADILMAAAFPYRHMYYALDGGQRGSIPVVLLGALHPADKWGYDRKMMYQAITQADAYIALTPFEKAYLVEKGIAADKIYVLGGGVDVAPFTNADGSAIRQQYRLGDVPVVGVMSRQTPLKRLDIVIKAMPAVWDKYPQARLLLAGARTAHSDTLDQLIAELLPEQQLRVTRIHDFPESEKPAILAAMDLVVHPSSNESFGIVFVEAWAAGKPVIGANIGAIAALIEEGKDGYLFTSGDPQSLAHEVIKLLDHPETRIAMGEAGRNKVLQNYSWEMIADRLRAMYLEVLGRNGNC